MTGGVERDVSVSDARAHLPELIERVRDGETALLSRYGMRVAAYLRAHGQRVAALVPVGVAERSERGD